MQQPREAAGGDVHAEPGPQHVRDLCQRDPQLGVQLDGERDGPGAELHAGRAQSVGGLEAVAQAAARQHLQVRRPHRFAQVRHTHRAEHQSRATPGNRPPPTLSRGGQRLGGRLSRTRDCHRVS